MAYRNSLGVRKGGNKVLGYHPPIWENQTEKKVENGMETGNIHFGI